MTGATPAPISPIPVGLPNASIPLPGVITAGQPSAEQLEELTRNGVSVVIDLRGADEARGFDEKADAARLGLEYHSIPVGATIGAAETDAVRALLRARGERTVLIHCKSANRVGGAMIPYLMLDEHQSRATALETAQRIGLRSDALALAALAAVDAASRDR